jgi:hypothetical protein
VLRRPTISIKTLDHAETTYARDGVLAVKSGHQPP